MAIEVDDLVVEDARFPGRQGRLLFACLVTEQGRPVPREELAQVLWNDAPPATWDKALTVLVSKLRSLLVEAGIDATHALTSAFGCYRLELPADAMVDVLAAATAVRDAERALADGDAAQALHDATTAEALTRTTFLPGDTGEWVETKRRELADLRWRAIHALSDATLRSGQPHHAVGWAQQAVALEPFRETGYRLLMNAHAAAGDRAEGLRAYDRCRRLLDEELGTDPSPETEEVYRHLLAAAATPSPPAPHESQTLARSEADAEREPAPPVDAGPPAGVVEAATSLPVRRRPAPRRPRRRPLLAAGVAVVVAAAATVVAVVLTRSRPERTAAAPAAPNSVVAIDARTNRITGQTPVGARPGAIAFAADALWVGNRDDESISRIAGGTLRPQQTISAGGVPSSVVAAGGAVWVAVTSPTSGDISVRRIDVEFGSFDRTVRVSNVDAGSDAALASSAGTLWVAPFTGEVTRVDLASGRVLGQLDPNAAPSAMAVGDGVAWVTDRFADTVTRVDLTGLATPIAVGHLPSAIAIDAGSVWVTDSGDDAVVRIDPQTQAVTATIPVGQAPLGLAVGAGSVWVADSGEGTVMRIDPRTDKVTAKITVGGSPQQVTVSGGRAWVTVDATARPAAAAVAGGTARLVSQEDVDSLDPALAYDGLSWQLLYATCAKLLNYPDLPGPTGTVLVPEVAQSLPVRSPDGTQYVFTIRKGFRFSPPSNAAVSAQTVKDTIERALSPGMRTPQSPPTSDEFADIVGEPAFTAGKAAHISGVIAAGYTLTIRLRAPAPDLLARLAQPFFCLVPSNTPVDPRGVRLIPSAGPYYVTSYLPGQGVVLHRNPNYHGDRPHRLGRIEVTVGVSAARAISEVEAGQADYVVDKVIQDPTTAQTLAQRYGPASPAAKAGHQQYFVHPTPGLDFFTFNTHRGPFTDVRLRQAVNYAIDRTALARFGDQGLPEHPTDDYLPPGMPGAAGAHIYPLTPDLAAARRLVRGHAGQTVVLYTFAVPRGREEAQIVSGDLAAIGLRVVVKTFSPGILFAKYATPGEPFDIGLIGWTADYLDPDNFLDLVLERGTSIPGFDNPKYRAEIAAATALSGPARFLAFRRIDADLIRNGAPWAAFSNPSSHELFSARMGCQSYGAFGLDLAALCIRHPAR